MLPKTKQSNNNQEHIPNCQSMICAMLTVSFCEMYHLFLRGSRTHSQKDISKGYISGIWMISDTMPDTHVGYI